MSATAGTKVVTIVIANDRPIVREGVRALLEREPGFLVVGEVGDGVEAIRIVERLNPDVLIVEVSMPGLGGLDVTREVRKHSPKTRVIVLSRHADEEYVRAAIGKGALGYVLDRSSTRDLVEAIRLAAAGYRYLSPPLTELAIEAYTERGTTEADPYEGLTPRERQVLPLAAEGLSNKTIGARLFISPRTVEVHRSKLKQKLGLRTHRDLVRYAVRRGFLPES